MTVSPLGDSAVVISISETVDAGTVMRVRAVAAEIERKRRPGIVDVVPAFGSVAVFINPTVAATIDALGELNALGDLTSQSLNSVMQPKLKAEAIPLP